MRQEIRKDAAFEKMMMRNVIDATGSREIRVERAEEAT